MFGYRPGPSKAELREMLAQAIRNTEAKKAAPIVAEPVDVPQIAERPLEPARFDRLSPDEVPTDFELFKEWSNYACVEWAPELIASGFYVIENEPWLRKISEEKFAIFIAKYEKWWNLSEAGKEALMNRDQRTSHLRPRYLDLARKGSQKLSLVSTYA